MAANAFGPIISMMLVGLAFSSAGIRLAPQHASESR